MTWDGRTAYHLFDILWLNGRAVTALPLKERRALLGSLSLHPPLQLVGTLDERDAPWNRAAREGWEDVIAKRRGSPYEHKRSKHWLKMKCEASQEFVVGGFTDPQGSRVGLSALLVGFYEDRELVFADKVGMGFDTRLLLDLRAELDRLEVAESPFTRAKGLPRTRAQWTRPQIVVQVSFIEWTVHGKLRHPRLLSEGVLKLPVAQSAVSGLPKPKEGLMKVTRIDVYQLKYGLLEGSYAWSGGHAVTSFTSSVVKLSTDAGLAGFGEVCPLGSAYMEAYAGGVPSGIAEIAPLVLGADPCRPHVLASAIDAVFSGHLYVKSPVDIACWDLFGQAAGMPVAELLGGRYADDYPLYRAISQESPDRMAESVRKYREEGYRRFQLKVGSDIETDIGRIAHVLDVLQPGDILVADANTGWHSHQAIRIVNALAGRDFYVEQPCPTLEECLRVRRHTNRPMVLDEVITGVVPLVRAIEAGAMDAVNIKISRVGGLTKARQIRDVCQAFGIAMTIEDSWGGDVATATIAHLAGSTRPDLLFTSTDFNSYIDKRIAVDAPFRQNGRLAVPTAPGLGIHVDERRLGAPVFTATA